MPTPGTPRGSRPGQGGRPTPPRQNYTWNEDDWATPVTPPPAAPQPGGAAPQRSPQQARAAARRARLRRRKQRQLMVAGTVVGIFVVAGIITLLLPKNDAVTATPDTTDTPAANQLVAPLPYAGTESSGGATAAQTLDWGTVGPTQQTADTGYTYTAAPAADTTTLQENGRVDTTWFADAAFLGDSLTAGFCESEYDIDVGGALICGYEGISPNTVVNRTTVNNPDRGEEIPMEVLAAAQPAKLYILLGTNALAGGASDEGFLNYYARMLDELAAALPNTTLYVQAILPATAEGSATAAGLAPEHLDTINAAIHDLCAERGVYFLDLNAEFRDDAGNLQADYAQPDGYHLTVAGYNKWVSFLCTHVPYDKDNPYQPGSTWYLTPSVQELLADLP